MVKPELIQLGNIKRVKELKKQRVQFVDFIKDQAEELCEVENPELRDVPEKLSSLKQKYVKRFSNQSVWCYFPWRQIAVRILKQPYFEKLRTARNKNLITEKEQTLFRHARIAVAGLSVGSNIARLCVLQGGPQYMNLADPDSISLTNLNRILAGVADIGRKKTDVLMENLFEMDPYLKLSSFDKGVDSLSVENFLRSGKEVVNVLVEEIDNLTMKIELRKKAERLKIPVISIADNADGIIVEVERYDQGYKFSQFARHLKVLSLKDPNNMVIQEKAVAMTKYIGIRDIPSRMLSSVIEVGKTLYSWPQLGGAAVFAGVVGAYCVREIVCGYKMSSGRYVFSFPEMMGIVSPDELKRKQKLLHHFK